VASKDIDQHVEDLRAKFQILSDNSLAINLEKYKFAVPEQDFLGHRAASITPHLGGCHLRVHSH
jgi:hypothetical protein